MRIGRFVSAGVGLVWLLLVSSVAAQTTLRVGLYRNRPKVFIDADGKPAGFFVDILDEIAAREQWQIEYVECSWAKCLDLLEQGQLDLMVDVAYSEERAQRFDFNRETVLWNWSQLYTCRDAHINDVFDLEGKTIAVVKGDIAYGELRSLIKQFNVTCTFQELDSFGAVMERLGDGRAQAGLVSRLFGLQHEQDYRVERTFLILSPFDLRFAAPKGRRKDLLAAIDKHLVAFKRDNTSVYYGARQRWIRSVERARLPAWLKYAGLAAAALLLLLIGFGLALRRRASHEIAFQALLLRSIQDLVVATDLDGRITFANSAVCEALGRSKQEIIGQSVRLFGDDPSRGADQDEILRRTRNDGQWRGQVVNTAADGTEVILDCRTHCLRDAAGRPTGMVGVSTDITERVRATARLETALKKREDLERIVNLSPATVWLWRNTDGWPVEYVSDNVRTFGYAPEDFLSGRVSFLQLVYPEDRSALAAHIADNEQDPECRSFTHQYRILTAAGDVRHVDNFTWIERAESGDVTHYHGVLLDVTAQKLAEKQRQAMEAQLRQSQKLESIGTLAGGVAHEINNPISGIMGYAQLLKDRNADGHKWIQEFADEIIQETERVATIVRNLLSFARYDRDRVYDNVRICDVVEGALSLVRTVLRHDQITLNVEVPEDLPLIHCHSQEIQQVLMNLITNARDALNAKYPGYDENKRIAISADVWKPAGIQYVRTTVTDTGTGIPETVRERIFDPFYTTKSPEKGTGLGLSISHGIVKDHDGELTVETQPDEWTRFHLDLPAADVQ